MDLSKLLDDNRERLRRLISLRIDNRLHGRVDASDVIQEAYVDAAKRFDEFQENPAVSGYVWLRFITCQKLMQLHRKHLGVKARDARREISINQPLGPCATSAVMAIEIAQSEATPSGNVAMIELRHRIQAVLDSMDESDREIIALRNYEQLSNAEAAETLGISSEAAYKRYVRALKRLKDTMRGTELTDE